MNLQSRWDEAKTIAGPDLWSDIEERSSMIPVRTRRERTLAATAAVVVAVGAGYFLLDAVNLSDQQRGPGVIRPGTSSAAGDPCELPVVRPTSLPWLESGVSLPAPVANELYQRITWEGPAGTEWEGAYVSVRVLADDIPEGSEASPPLPDGTHGTILMHQREWDVFWQPSDRYCGSLALYVFLPQTSSDQARIDAMAIAGSMVEQAGLDAS